MPPSRNAGANLVATISATRSNAGQVRSGADLVKELFVAAIEMILVAKNILARMKEKAAQLMVRTKWQPGSKLKFNLFEEFEADGDLLGGGG
jgi:hypothetical protein